MPRCCEMANVCTSRGLCSFLYVLRDLAFFEARRLVPGIAGRGERMRRMRSDVTFQSCGFSCRRWLFAPEDAADNHKFPVIIMAHGFSGVKEMGLAELAEKYAAAGYAVLVFDYRHFGGSDGNPRGQLFPLEMVEDYRNAISWACEQPNIDPNSIGLWGTSYSGGLAVYAAS